MGAGSGFTSPLIKFVCDVREGKRKGETMSQRQKRKHEGEGWIMLIQTRKDAVQWDPKQLHCSYSKLHFIILSDTSTNVLNFFPFSFIVNVRY